MSSVSSVHIHLATASSLTRVVLKCHEPEKRPRRRISASARPSCEDFTQQRLEHFVRAEPPPRTLPETRLARAVRATAETAARTVSAHEPHRQTNWLRDVIHGGQDGLVNILGIILGVIAAGGSNTVLLAVGFAAAITESISMGAVGYTSATSERDYYEAQKGQERREIETMPEVERKELRDIYA